MTKGGWVYIRGWKFALIERANPDWRDLRSELVREERDPGSSPG
jgi:hypothetical protein